MPIRLELSRRAQADLDDIRDYSVDRFGFGRAIDYLDTVERAFRRVMVNPQIGVAHPRFRDVRSLSAGGHRVYYTATDDAVTIVRVLHKAMDAARHL